MYERPALERRLARGELLFSHGQFGPLWEIESGLILLSCSSDKKLTPCGLARRGDVLGAEVIWGAPYSVSACAITASTVRHAPAKSSREDIEILGRAYTTLHQRHAQFLSLRTGPAQERIERAFDLLGSATAGSRIPGDQADRIAGVDLARLLDLTEETVSRLLRRRRLHRVAQASHASANSSLSLAA